MNLTELIFASLPATSSGVKPLLKTRKVSGKDGSCEKYHMKLHIYVCIPGKGKKELSELFNETSINLILYVFLKLGQTRMIES